MFDLELGCSTVTEAQQYPEAYPLKMPLLQSSHRPKHTSEAYPIVRHPGPGTSNKHTPTSTNPDIDWLCLFLPGSSSE